jgi:hypothetical protein
MSGAIRFPLARLALLAALFAAPAAARAQAQPQPQQPPPQPQAQAQAQAQDNMLRGPHPFLKDNELSAHVLLALGAGDSPNGTKLAFDYGFKLARPAWLNLQLNFQRGTCHMAAGDPPCPPDTGSAFETLVGVKGKWPTAIPLVPFVKVGGGFVFVFPNNASAATGVAGRASGGANYFFFDWLGLGAEIGYSLGYHAATTPGQHAYAVLDFGGGIEFQF